MPLNDIGVEEVANANAGDGFVWTWHSESEENLAASIIELGCDGRMSGLRERRQQSEQGILGVSDRVRIGRNGRLALGSRPDPLEALSLLRPLRKQPAEREETPARKRELIS
jgi:hypothetical protein